MGALSYLPPDEEVAIVQAHVPPQADAPGTALVWAMVALAGLTREGLAAGCLSTRMSPRTVVTLGGDIEIFRDPALAFLLTFLNKYDEAERVVVAQSYPQCVDDELDQSYQNRRTRLPLDITAPWHPRRPGHAIRSRSTLWPQPRCAR